MKWKWPVLVVAGVLVIYYATAAWLIRYDVGRLLFPPAALMAPTSERDSFRVAGRHGEVLVRLYGTDQMGCVLFFPGQHAGAERYERTLFPSLTNAGIEVLSVSYPGQEGASGQAKVEDIAGLLSALVSKAGEYCPPEGTVFVGRSLGATLALYSARDASLAGIVLEGVAPSLSSAVRSHVSHKWFLVPLSALPIEQLLSHDFSFAEGRRQLKDIPVVIFQGSADTTTPSESLLEALGSAGTVDFRQIAGGTHSNTYMVARDEYLGVILSMLINAEQKMPNKSLQRTRYRLLRAAEP